jgi:hypothetical protein
MKIFHLFLTICVAGCGHQHTKKQTNVLDEQTLKLPEVSFTYAPRSVKCENLLTFMRAYSSKTESLIVADAVCQNTANSISRRFLIPKDNGYATIDLNINWPKSFQAIPFELSTFVNSEADGIFQRDRLQEVFERWVKTNFKSPSEVCTKIIESGLECPPITEEL